MRLLSWPAVQRVVSNQFAAERTQEHPWWTGETAEVCHKSVNIQPSNPCMIQICWRSFFNVLLCLHRNWAKYLPATHMDMSVSCAMPVRWHYVFSCSCPLGANWSLPTRHPQFCFFVVGLKLFRQYLAPLVRWLYNARVSTNRLIWPKGIPSAHLSGIGTSPSNARSKHPYELLEFLIYSLLLSTPHAAFISI